MAKQPCKKSSHMQCVVFAVVIIFAGCSSEHSTSESPTSQAGHNSVFKACDLSVAIKNRKLTLRLDSRNHSSVDLSQYGLETTYLRLVDVNARSAIMVVHSDEFEETVEVGPKETMTGSLAGILRMSFIGGTTPPFDNSAKIGKAWRICANDDLHIDAVLSYRVRSEIRLPDEEKRAVVDFLSAAEEFGPPGDCDGTPEFMIEVLEATGKPPLMCLLRFECGGRIDVLIDGQYTSYGFSAGKSDAVNLQRLLRESEL